MHLHSKNLSNEQVLDLLKHPSRAPRGIQPRVYETKIERGSTAWNPGAKHPDFLPIEGPAYLRYEQSYDGAVSLTVSPVVARV